MDFRTAFIFLLLICLFGDVRAQERWIEGEVTFSADSSFNGYFSFNKHVEKEILAIKQGNRLIAIPPKDILSAEGVVNGEEKTWRSMEFSRNGSNFNVHLFLEEVYAGQNLNLYRRDLSFIRWSPYADIVYDAVEFDSYKHLINNDVLLLKRFGENKMVVINRPNAWNPNKYVINKNLLCHYLNTDRNSLKNIVKENDLKLDKLQDIVTLIMIMDDRSSQQLSFSQGSK